jgi:hypothetical protein
MRLVILFLSALLVSCGTVSPLQITNSYEVGCLEKVHADIFIYKTRSQSVLRICGAILPGMAASVSKLIDKKIVNKIEIISPGGVGLEAIQLANVINEAKLSTSFPSYCSSACIILFSKLEFVSVGEKTLFIDHLHPSDRYTYLSAILMQMGTKSLNINAFQKLKNFNGPGTYFDTEQDKYFSLKRISALRVKCLSLIQNDKLYVSYAGNFLDRKEYDYWLIDKSNLLKMAKNSNVVGQRDYLRSINWERIVNFTGEKSRNRYEENNEIRLIPKGEYRVCEKGDFSKAQTKQ